MDAPKLPFDIASFSNSEIYSIISDLLYLGGLNSQLIEPEKLYISPTDSYLESHDGFNFLFISTLPIISETQKSPDTTIVLGSYSWGDDEIKIYSAYTSSSFEEFHDYKIDIKNINDLLKNYTEKEISIRPFYFVNGITRLLNQTDILKRVKPNKTFSLYYDSPLPQGFREEFKFPDFPDFSGDYFLIARPHAEAAKTTTIVYEFEIIDNSDDDMDERGYIQSQIIIKEEYITSDSYENFINNKTPKISLTSLNLAIKDKG